MNYTANRLEQLENETHGELALGTTTTVNGWNVTLLPSSEVVAELTLDYNNGIEFNWDEKNSFVRISEMLPEKIFKTVTNCECKATDISSGITNANTIIATARALPSEVATGEWNFYPLEYVRSIEGYTLPTKLHIVWTVRGIANS